MKKIDFSLSENISSEEIANKTQVLKDKVLNSKEVRIKINELKITTKEEFDNNFGLFVSYHDDLNQCRGCKSLEECKKEVKGVVVDLVRDDDGDIKREFNLCKFKKEEILVNKNYIFSNIPSILKSMELEHLETRVSRADLEIKLLEIDQDFKKKEGILIYGPENSGKTYPLIAFCNGMVRKNYTCAFLSVRELLDLYKSSFDTNEATIELDEKIKNVDILVLDDLGDEKISDWSRDDILSPLLDHRIKKDLLTFLITNYDINDLELLYSQTKLGEQIGKIKAKKFLEKIFNTCPKKIKIN